MLNLFKKYWFLLGLFFIFFITLLDITGSVSTLGNFLKNNHGADAVIILIFFCSGFVIKTDQVKEGLKDVKGVLTALFLIFVAAPLISAVYQFFSMDTGIIIGIILVSLMPCTLSSGVVMTAGAGGNMAHALLITILANSLSVFTIPYTLSLFFSSGSGRFQVDIDTWAIMMKIAFFVVLPLCSGLFIKNIIFSSLSFFDRISSKIQIANQCFVLGIVWMALSMAKPVILNNLDKAPLIIFVVFSFHGFLLLATFLFVKILKIPVGKRESVIFMGGQKTLPLSLIIQVSLFPEYGLALVVCVMHHIIHLFMDGYIVEKIRKKS